MEDIYFNILLHSHIRDIVNLCQTNKEFNHLCQDKYFWHEKFNHDHLAPNDEKNFIKSYILAKIDKIIEFIVNEENYIITFYITSNKEITRRRPINIINKIVYHKINNLWFMDGQIIKKKILINYLKNIYLTDYIVYQISSVNFVYLN